MASIVRLERDPRDVNFERAAENFARGLASARAERARVAAAEEVAKAAESRASVAFERAQQAKRDKEGRELSELLRQKEAEEDQRLIEVQEDKDEFDRQLAAKETADLVEDIAKERREARAEVVTLGLQTAKTVDLRRQDVRARKGRVQEDFNQILGDISPQGFLQIKPGFHRNLFKIVDRIGDQLVTANIKKGKKDPGDAEVVEEAFGLAMEEWVDRFVDVNLGEFIEGIIAHMKVEEEMERGDIIDFITRLPKTQRLIDDWNSSLGPTDPRINVATIVNVTLKRIEELDESAVNVEGGLLGEFGEGFKPLLRLRVEARKARRIGTLLPKTPPKPRKPERTLSILGLGGVRKGRGVIDRE